MTNPSTAALADALVRGRNADGGWGYYAGKVSRLEPTSLALLALFATNRTSAAEHIMRSWPSREGLLLERAGGEPNYAFHALALLVIQACGIEHTVGTAALVSSLARVKGVRLEVPSGGRQDNTLQAWSWIAETFSWVEPTGWALLCLKKFRRSSDATDADLSRRSSEDAKAERIAEGERVLLNRVCVTGGWNYGNSDMLGQDLRPYVPTTAIALLGMQDRLAVPAVQKSVAWLEQHATSERSTSALALALMALRACGRSAGEARDALLAQMPIALELGNLASIALASCALNQEQTHGAFTL